MGRIGLSAEVRNQRVTLAPLKVAPEADFGGFTSWRGLSGRRYIVSVYHPASVPDYGDAVLIAVGRNRHGGRRILAVGTGSPEPLAAIAGCDEIHVHLLARDVGDKARLLADLALPALKRLNREDALLPAA
ncbi:MAG: hypothetical protein FGM26_00750 [Beijerinckiaceae bacterium]|nr:hypothetical protein [Beijerinckiaceae bacterium]